MKIPSGIRFGDVDDGVVDGVEYLVEQVDREAEGWEDDDGVDERTKQNATFANPLAYAMSDAVFEWERATGFPIGDEFDGGDEPTLTDVSDVRVLAELFEPLRKVLNLGLQVLDDLVFFEQVDRGKSGRAAERIACVRMAVEECFRFRIVAQEGGVDLVRCEGGRDREVAARQAFAQAHQVGGNLFVFAREHRAGATEACGDFVRDDENVVDAAEFDGVP